MYIYMHKDCTYEKNVRLYGYKCICIYMRYFTKIIFSKNIELIHTLALMYMYYGVDIYIYIARYLVCQHIHSHAHIRVYIWRHMRIYACIHIHIYIHTYIHIHTYKYIYTGREIVDPYIIRLKGISTETKAKLLQKFDPLFIGFSLPLYICICC